MKKSVKSNMYTNILEETWELFASYLYGQENGLVVVVSSCLLGKQAITALQNSFAQLGYGREACTFMVLQSLMGSSQDPSQAPSNSSSSLSKAFQTSALVPFPDFASTFSAGSSSELPQASSPLPALSGKDLLAALEGLDPLLLVITDTEAIKACAEAYRQPIEQHKRNRVSGRELRAFQSFESMLEDPREKQKAWALLKTLPKLVS